MGYRQRNLLFISISFLVCVCLILVASSFVKKCFQKEYLILFQNNYELRPTGGFLGSYGRLKLEKGQLTLSIQDIYVPDGQMDGHVDPPNAIQTAFGQGWYKLRDSNFDPDFPRSAKTMQWFFEKGKEKPVDGVIAINLEVFKAVLDVLGPIALPDEEVLLTSDSFYQLMQSEAEIGFFPGSQQKQVYLSKVGRATLEKLHTTTVVEKIKLGQKLLAVARQNHILVYSNDSSLQRFITMIGFDGALKRGRGDYFSLIEANLGTNKANCCIKRNLELRMENGEENRNDSKEITHTTTITYTNENPATLKNPPYFWGGAYVNYLRAYIPIESEVVSVTVSGRDRKLQMTPDPVYSGVGKSQENITQEPIYLDDRNWEQRLATHSAIQTFDVEKLPEKKLQSIGLFVVIDALKQENVQIIYTLPQTIWSVRSLTIQKQSGVQTIPYVISYGDEKQELKIERDVNLGFFP